VTGPSKIMLAVRVPSEAPTPSRWKVPPALAAKMVVLCYPCKSSVAGDRAAHHASQGHALRPPVDNVRASGIGNGSTVCPAADHDIYLPLLTMVAIALPPSASTSTGKRGTINEP
jgi:hypothetical protein